MGEFASVVCFLFLFPVPKFCSYVFSANDRTSSVLHRDKHERELTSSANDFEENFEHDNHLSVIVNLNGEEKTLDLELNKYLISGDYFEKYQENGKFVVKRPNVKDSNHCHYLGKIRQISASWVSMSVCNGIKGVLYDGKNIYQFESNTTDPTSNLLNFVTATNFSTGVWDFNNEISTNRVYRDISKINIRRRRNIDEIYGPHNANKSTRYIELILVVDNSEYRAFDKDVEKVNQYCKDIVNCLNALFAPLNILVTLVGVEIWTAQDEIPVEPDGDKTLRNFLHYRKHSLSKKHPNDNAQLITAVKLDKNVIGKTLKGPICSLDYSGGVSTDFGKVAALEASTLARMLGYNLGMPLDSQECKCSDDKCIMSTTSPFSLRTEWSSCSRENVAKAFSHGMDHCLRNKPKTIFRSPVCGNGFLEVDEQCDCGLPEQCDNKCCNSTTCTLHPNATCATGECCDLNTCQLYSSGKQCRNAERECDLPEYCTGRSEHCPQDVFKLNGLPCENASAFCYEGDCKTHDDQCRLLWGPGGVNSHWKCYDLNTKGNRHGNCGFDKLTTQFAKCESQSTNCGRLQCQHQNNKLEFGIEEVAILSRSFITQENGSIVSCRNAVIDMGWTDMDPGLVPNGAKCGENQMCLNQKCTSVESLKPHSCPFKCSGHGICNSRGHCHCDVGYAPPLCNTPGTGGSQDSGPSERLIDKPSVPTTNCTDVKSTAMPVLSTTANSNSSTMKIN